MTEELESLCAHQRLVVKLAEAEQDKALAFMVLAQLEAVMAARRERRNKK